MLRIQVEKWSFWSPESADPIGWARHWQEAGAERLAGDPDVTAIPAMHRRRMSRLSRMALAAALDVIPDEAVDYSIFCSQHGEIVRTSSLLLSMTQGIELSPTAFAQSGKQKKKIQTALTINDVTYQFPQIKNEIFKWLSS